MVNSLTDRYYKLVLVIGGSNTGKTSLFKQICNDNTYEYINLNLALSEKLKEIPKDDRCYLIQDYMEGIVRSKDGEVIVLDNIEMIFSKHLQVEPLGILKNIAKYRKIIVAWPGSIKDGYLTYAEPAHEDYIRYCLDELECLYMNMERGL